MGRADCRACQPPGWSKWVADFEPTTDEARLRSRNCALFGDGRSEELLKQLALDGAIDVSVRAQAMESLGQTRSTEAIDFLVTRIVDRDTGAAAVEALRFADREDVPQAIITRWSSMRPEARVAALATLTARASSAQALLDAVRDGQVSADEVGPYEWRQIAALGSESLEQQVAELWPRAQLVFDDRLARSRLADRLTEDLLSTGDLARGGEVFRRVCANCHRLGGFGERIGPDLTGSQRDNLNYLIENIGAPSNEVATSFRTSLIELTDGQVIVGVIVKQLPDRIEVQTKDALRGIDARDIEIVQESGRSLMPDGLADSLNDQDLADLVKYLREAGR
ncbi:MAG: c-type cytochrome [Pirellulaceae bacterium]